MTSRYQCAGRSTATGASADKVIGMLWNPHASKPLWVREIWYAKTVATADYIEVSRATAVGTGPNSTVTPDIDNDRDRMLAPGTGALEYMGVYATTDPTLATPPLARYALPAAIGSGVVLVFDPPVRVAAGEGLAVATAAATIGQPADVTFVWEE